MAGICLAAKARTGAPRGRTPIMKESGKGSGKLRASIEAHPDWLTEARLPSDAPDLNAVEGAWQT